MNRGVVIDRASSRAIISHREDVLNFFDGQLLFQMGVLQTLKDFGF